MSLSIVCPALNAKPFDIHTIVLSSISTPEPSGTPGEMKIVLMAVEYVDVPQVQQPATKQIKGKQGAPPRKPNAISQDIRGPKSPGSGAGGAP